MTKNDTSAARNNGLHILNNAYIRGNINQDRENSGIFQPLGTPILVMFHNDLRFMESEQKLTNFGKFTHSTWYKKTLN